MELSLLEIFLTLLFKIQSSSAIIVFLSWKDLSIFQRSGVHHNFITRNGSSTVKTNLFYFVFSSKHLPHSPRVSKSWSLPYRDLVILGISVKWEISLNYCPKLMLLQVCVALSFASMASYHIQKHMNFHWLKLK